MKKMKVALVGYGKMGKAVEKIARERGHTLCDIDECDVAIEFTHPDSVVENIKKIASLGKDMVVGTTGWYEHFPEIKKVIENSNTGFFYSPNFSLGVSIFLKLVLEASKLFNPHLDYDAAGLEIHHTEKRDAPSGTALAMEKKVLEGMPRKKEDFQLSSLRCGTFPGTHTLHFDSKVDRITITHEAKGREGFALGALLAAEWMHGKKGIYTMEDLC